MMMCRLSRVNSTSGGDARVRALWLAVLPLCLITREANAAKYHTTFCNTGHNFPTYIPSGVSSGYPVVVGNTGGGTTPWRWTPGMGDIGYGGPEYLPTLYPTNNAGAQVNAVSANGQF